MTRTLSGARLLALLWSLILLSACGGGGSPTTPSAQQLLGTLGIDIRALAVEQNSAVIPITLSVPRTGAVDAIPVRLRIAWRRTAVPTEPQRLMTAAPGSLNLNHRDTIIDIPVEGREVTFLWDALADLGLDWPTGDEITVHAGILAANANDPRQAVCDFQPIIRVNFGPGGIACGTPIPMLEDFTTETAIIGQEFDFQLIASGGEPPLSFEVLDPVSGNATGNPDIGFGLFLNQQTGLISGVAAADAPSQISFFTRVVDSCGSAEGQRAGSQFAQIGGRFDQARIVIPVEGGQIPVCADAPQISTTSLPNGALNTPYEFQLQATGGEGALTWSTDSKSADFSVDANGLITGTPLLPNAYTVTVQVADSCPNIQTASAQLVIQVPCGDGPTFSSPATLPTAAIGQLYDTNFFVPMPNGLGSVVLESGSLPGGIVFTPIRDEDNGRFIVQLRGTPSVAAQAGQNFVFTLRAADTCPAAALTVSQGFTLPVDSGTVCTEPLPQITSPTGTSTLPSGADGAPYSALMSVTGGTAPVGAITIVSGAPAGFSIAANGRTLQGTLPASGPSSYDITLEVSDGCSTPRIQRGTFTLPVAPSCPTLSITTTSLPNAINGTKYSTQLNANGGFGSQTWALGAGSALLPGGLVLGSDGLLSGTPDDAAQTYALVVEVRDTCPSGAQVITQSLDLVLEDPPCPVPTIDGVKPSDPVFQQPYSLQLVASGGVSPFSWSLAGGRLPSGLDLDTDGMISGTPEDPKEINVPFNFTAQVSDGCTPIAGIATIDLTLTVRPPGCATLRILTTALDDALFDSPYLAQIDATGELPISFNIISGSLPEGMSLSLGGLISGTPDNSEEIGDIFTFTVEALDSCIGGSQSATETYSITLNTTITCTPLVILTSSLPDPQIDTAYSESLSADGVAPFTWSLQGGALPTGLSVNPGGLIEGTPIDSKQAGQEFNFTLGALDDCEIKPQFRTKDFTITLRPDTACVPLNITTDALPNANWQQAYNFAITADGVAPLSWSLISGSLPTGITMNAAGVLTGTPTDGNQIGSSFPITVEVVDACILEPQIESADLVLVLDGPNCTSFSFAPTTLSDPTYLAPYVQELTTTGGVAPFAFSLRKGDQLPSGMDVDAMGAIFGTPDDPDEIDEEFTFSIEAVDSCPLGAQHVSNTYTIRLLPESCNGLSIVTTTLPNATNTEPYSFQMEATGGKDPLSWSADGLPSDLVMTADGLIQGTPDTDPGTYDVEFTLFDSCTPLQIEIVELSLTVGDPVCPTISITTDGLMNPVLGQSYDERLEAEGGTEPYSWRLVGGQLPSGMTLSSLGDLGGAPNDIEEVSTLFSFTVEAADECEFGPATTTATFEITLLPAPACGRVIVDSTEVENPTYQQSYFTQLDASGGQPPYHWTLESSLPDGLTLSDEGGLSGLPTNPDDIGQFFSIDVSVLDSCPFTPGQAFGTFSFTMEGPSCEEIGISNTGFNNPQLGQGYNQTLFGTGEGELTWSLLSGNLPAGIDVDAAGALSGIPTDPEEVGAQFTFTLAVTDECLLGPQSAEAEFTVVLNPPQSCGNVSVNDNGPPNAEWQVEFPGYTFHASGGQPPYTWAISDGELPDGLSLETDGSLGGIVTDQSLIGQQFDFTVIARDSCPFNQGIGEETFAIRVLGPTCAQIEILSSELSNPTFGAFYSFPLTGVGEGELDWTLESGSLPEGLQLSSGGVLFGTPSNTDEIGARFPFVVRLTDECLLGVQTITKGFIFTLEPPPSCGDPNFDEDELPEATWQQDYSHQIAMSAGQPPYDFALIGGSLPSGLSMNAAGVVSGTPDSIEDIGQTFDFEIEVTDSCPFNPAVVSQNFTIFVDGPTCDPISINNTGFSAPVLGRSYSATLFGSGEGTLTWSLASGSLPTGMSVDPTGSLSGTPNDPQQVGTFFPFTLGLRDTCQLGPQMTTASFSFTLQPAPPCAPLPTIVDDRFPDATFFTPYDFQLTATGGQPPYTWGIIDGNLPPGLTLMADGHVTGTITDPQWTNSEWFPTVAVTDSCPFNPGEHVKTLALDVFDNCSPVTITNTGFGDPTLLTPYSADLFGSGGQPPYEWSLGLGSLPIGMSIVPQGRLAGTPTSPDQVSNQFTFQIRMNDSCPGLPKETNRTYQFTLRAPNCGSPLFITTTELTNPYFNVAYDQPIDTQGGTPPIVFSHSAGTLPTGMSLTPLGRLIGTPSDARQIGSLFTFAIRAVDSCVVPQLTEQEITFQLLPTPTCPTLSFNNTGFTGPVYLQPYTAGLLIFGGTPPYHAELFSGALPKGLSIGIAPFNGQWSILGTPTDPTEVGKSFTFGIRVFDECEFGPAEVIREFQFTETGPACAAPTVTNKTPTFAMYNVPYTFQLTASGGRPPYTWKLHTGSLPDGLSVTTDGRIIGTANNPDQVNVRFTYSVKATDVCGTFGTPKTFSMTLLNGG